jgi:hypothetical protein
MFKPDIHWITSKVNPSVGLMVVAKGKKKVVQPVASHFTELSWPILCSNSQLILKQGFF